MGMTKGPSISIRPIPCIALAGANTLVAVLVAFAVQIVEPTLMFGFKAQHVSLCQ